MLARYALPHFFRHIVGTRSKELFVIAALWILLGMSWALSLVGFSLAIGAFLAGLAVSESEYSHQVFADIRPFRDGLNSLFFISIGMLVDIGFISGNAATVLLVILAVLVGKAILITLSVAVHPHTIAGGRHGRIFHGPDRGVFLYSARSGNAKRSGGDLPIPTHHFILRRYNALDSSVFLAFSGTAGQ